MRTALTTRTMASPPANRWAWGLIATLALSACSTTPPPPTTWLALPAISSPAPEAAQAPATPPRQSRPLGVERGPCGQ